MREQDELRRLKKENRELRKRLHDYEKEQRSAVPVSESDGDCYLAGNYFSYLLARMRKKSFYGTAYKYFKNSLWVTRIFRWILFIYKYVQAGAFVILYTAAFILIIPIFLATAVLTLVSALLLRYSNAKKLLPLLKKDVVFLIPDGKDGFDKDFLKKKAEEIQDATVLIVSPFFLDRTGVSDSEKMYVCYRRENENTYILRNYFFFYFRKRLQRTYTHNIREIRTFGDKEL